MLTSKTTVRSEDAVPPLSCILTATLLAQRRRVLADARLLSSIYGLMGSEIDAAEERADVMFLGDVSNPSAAVLNAVDETCIRFGKPSIRSPGIPIGGGQRVQRLVVDGDEFRFVGPERSKPRMNRER